MIVAPTNHSDLNHHIADIGLYGRKPAQRVSLPIAVPFFLQRTPAMALKRIRYIEPTRKISRRPRPIDPSHQLLFSRAQVCAMLGGVHPATVARLEEAKKLRAVRLSPEKENCRVYYRREDVLALVDGLTAN
jgi:hypothetical protein